MLIPIAVGLLAPDGTELPLKQLSEETDVFTSLELPDGSYPTTVVLKLTEQQQVFVFADVAQPPVPSLLRNFSAPVKLESSAFSDDNLTFLLANDSDAFNRWEAAQMLYKRLILSCYDSAPEMKPTLIAALKQLLLDSSLDKAFVAYCLEPPSTKELLSSMTPPVDPIRLHHAHAFVRHGVASALKEQLTTLYHQNTSSEPYAWTTEHAAQRSLKNTALGLLSTLSAEDASILELCSTAFKIATNMTDTMGALQALNSHASPARNEALQSFYDKWKANNTIILQYFKIVDGACFAGNMSDVGELLSCEASVGQIQLSVAQC